MVSPAVLAAAALALAGASSASAIPAATPTPTPKPIPGSVDDPDMVPFAGEPDVPQHLVKRVDALNPWVTVNDYPEPETTYTPSMTTFSDGSTSLVNAAPHDFTASVYTYTTKADIYTSTGEPPNPTAQNTRGVGSFPVCHNLDGPNAPICHPYPNSTLHTGNTYYVTWDIEYFNTTGKKLTNSSTEVILRLDTLNKTSNEYVLLKDDFGSSKMEWGFASLAIDEKLLGDNITIQLITREQGSNTKNHSTPALPVAIKPPGYGLEHPTPVPKGKEITIALPVAFGTIALLVVGLCIWNRQTRRIQLGNIMSRSRHGYSGRGERRRMFRSRANKDGPDAGAIQLDSAPGPDAPVYRDVPDRQRRGSDDLDSLAGSPVQDTFQQQGTTGGRNAFRDEMQRQENERRGGF